MCTISDHSVWKLYLILTDGKALPTIRQHMAKICPFLESKADIFSSYLPVSDINLAIEKSIWHGLRCPLWCVFPVCIFGRYSIWDHIFLAYVGLKADFFFFLMRMWRQPVVIIFPILMRRAAADWQKRKCYTCGRGSSSVLFSFFLFFFPLSSLR